MKKIATKETSPKKLKNFINAPMPNKVLRPSNADIENVRNMANYNAGSNAYDDDDMSVVLNILYTAYLSKDNARVCWDSTEKMFQAVWNAGQPVLSRVSKWKSSLLRTKKQESDKAQDLIRVVIHSFLSTLEAGKITTIAKPQCLEQGSKEQAGKGDGNVNTDLSKQPPPGTKNLFDELVQNPYAIAGGTVLILGGGFLLWKWRNNSK